MGLYKKFGVSWFAMPVQSVLTTVTTAVTRVRADTSSEWGDRDSLDLPGAQLQLLQALVKLSWFM